MSAEQGWWCREGNRNFALVRIFRFVQKGALLSAFRIQNCDL